MTEDQLQEGGGRGLFTLKNLLLLLVGFVLGYIIKEQAVQNITMGYDDYKIIINEKQVEVKNNQIEESMLNDEQSENVEGNKNINNKEERLEE